MNYEGKLYGKVGRHYIPLMLSTQEVIPLEDALLFAEWVALDPLVVALYPKTKIWKLISMAEESMYFDTTAELYEYWKSNIKQQ